MKRRNGVRAWLVRGVATWLAGGICLAIAIVAWSAFRATYEWHHTSALLVQRRAEQTADLLVRALLRDMRGAEEQVLKRLHWDQLILDRPHELTNVIAAAFARYPYMESFFAWNGEADVAPVFFTRTDRQPLWLPCRQRLSRFPVTIVREAAAHESLIEHVARGARHGRQMAVVETMLGGEAYQIVTRLMYRTAQRDRFKGAFGFLVNVQWVRTNYFPELVDQVARISGASEELRMTILDEHGDAVAGEARGTSAGPIVTRRLRPAFFDASLAAIDTRDTAGAHDWTVTVGTIDDPTLALAFHGATRTLLIAVGAAIAMAVALLLAARAVRASADLATIRADFVSTVTHELKTPLTTIRTVAEALVYGRLADPKHAHEYAQILDQEAKRLTRLVDNLLAYSRVTDLSEVYAFEPLASADLIDDALRRFEPQFAHQGFRVSVQLAPDLPLLRADKTALDLVLDNLIDNAVRYSGRARWLGIRATPVGGVVQIAIADHGVGIPADELTRVTQRFVRGRTAPSSGSGLGLAIAARVLADHGGRLSIASTVDEGTTVEIAVPVMEV